MSDQAAQGFYRIKAAAAYLDIGQTRLRTLIAEDPDFPPAIKLSNRHTGFTRIQLDEWLAIKQSKAEQQAEVQK